MVVLAPAKKNGEVVLAVAVNQPAYLRGSASARTKRRTRDSAVIYFCLYMQVDFGPTAFFIYAGPFWTCGSVGPFRPRGSTTRPGGSHGPATHGGGRESIFHQPACSAGGACSQKNVQRRFFLNKISETNQIYRRNLLAPLLVFRLLQISISLFYINSLIALIRFPRQQCGGVP
jgi:hypothetical protein